MYSYTYIASQAKTSEFMGAYNKLECLGSGFQNNFDHRQNFLLHAHIFESHHRCSMSLTMMDVTNISHPFLFSINDMMHSTLYFQNDDPERSQQHEQRRPPTAPTNPIAEPDFKDCDVICGRDKLCCSHVGNKRFRQLVMKHRERYQTATSRDLKAQITFQIIADIKRQGGRFLKHDGVTGEWQPVPDAYAHEKVSHALRSAKDPNRLRVKKQREPAKMSVASPEDDALFRATLADQKRILEFLVSHHATGMMSDENFEDVEALLSKI